MPPTIIQKRSNPIATRLKNTRDGENKKFIFCEGEKVVVELMASTLAVDSLYASIEHQALIEKIMAERPARLPVTYLSSSVMEYVSDLTTPPGIIALAKRPERPVEIKIDSQIQNPFFLLIHAVQLPQNLGALLRTAEGAGITEVWTTKTCADPFGPKAIRGASGSAFRLPIRTNVDFKSAVTLLRNQNIATVAADQNGKTDYTDFDWKQGVALAVGSEGTGFSDDEIAHMSWTVRIPMAGKVESLNVGTAAAVCLFEAARQRRNA